MDVHNLSDDERRATNPLFGDSKFKLGTFSTNLSGGCTMSSGDGVFELTWPNSVTLARMADDMKFEALVPVGRWKGFGGDTNFNGDGFESYTWAAAMSALTKNAGIFATSHVSTVHPCLAAKQGMTIDHISGGRFTLNVVCGWVKSEMEMFGTPQLEHDRRYDQAIEWLEIIRRLWSSNEEFDFDGKFFEVKNAICDPKPIQKPYPVVMSAGSSDVGRKFAAKYADVAFTAHQGFDDDTIRSIIETYHKRAWEEHGRSMSVWTNTSLFQGETEKEAQELYDYYVHETGDHAGADNFLTMLGIEKAYLEPERVRSLKEFFIAGYGGFKIIGTKEQIVDGLQHLSDLGFDGTLLSWANYIDGMREFQEVTYPLVQQAGLHL